MPPARKIESGPLSRLVARRLREAGADHRILNIDAPLKPWPAIPLYTEETLMGRPLQEHIALHTGKSIEHMHQVYEEFLSHYWAQRRSTKEKEIENFFVKKVGLAARPVQSLFRRPRSARRHGSAEQAGAVISFAALVSYNFPHEVEHSENRFVVRAGGYAFGMADGFPVSTRGFPASGYSGSKLRVPGGRLCDIERLPFTSVKMVTNCDRARCWVESRSPRLPDESAVILALNSLRYRRVKSDEALAYSLSRMHTVKEIQASIKLCRKHREFATPLRTLSAELVPTYIPETRFTALFGWSKAYCPGFVGEAKAKRWDEALDLLEEELLEEAGYAIETRVAA